MILYIVLTIKRNDRMKIRARNKKSLRLVELEFDTMAQAIKENPGYTDFEQVE